jgi:preprotein translocase subunit SecF
MKKRILPFSRYFKPAAIIAVAAVALGIVGVFARGGFNLGIDFQAGLIQEIQFAPPALGLTYHGQGNASIAFSRTQINIIITGAGVDSATHAFPFAAYAALNDLIAALNNIEGLQASALASGAIQSQWLVQSAQGDPQLGAESFRLHYLSPDAPPIAIEDVRATLDPLGTAAVQILGAPAERRFMIRMEDDEGNRAPQIMGALEESFGAGNIAVTRADFVGSRFSRELTYRTGQLLIFTLLLILAYAAVRFKLQFGAGAVIAIVYDMFFTLSFIIWIGMEFNTTTIAAILTIIGYSTNDTIVVFDRIRENRRLYPEDKFVDVLNRSLSETLNRTIITSVTTLLAVFALFIFTTGAMRDFALALIVGILAGIFSTTFIASGFVYYWDLRVEKKAKQKLLGQAALAK